LRSAELIKTKTNPRRIVLLKNAICCTLLLILYFLLFSGCADAAIFDRVVAFVGDQAITLSEFREAYRNTIKVSPDVTEDDVINTMINRLLLVKEAEKYRIEASTQDEMIREYVDFKVRALIRVSESDIETFYKDNMAQFPEKEYEEVRGEIEKYLTEKEVNERLKETLKELRKKAYIKIQLAPES
jgi:hypothetical protein